MFSIDLIELAAKVNDIQNEKLKYYLSLKDTNDIALKTSNILIFHFEYH